MKYFKISFFLILSLSVLTLNAQHSKSGYRYIVDLTRVVDDRVYVEVSTPKVTTDETVFYLPKIIPGTYAIADYGRFVYDLNAFDKKGNKLATEKVGENGWKIATAKRLTKITYWVDDVIDTPKEGPSIYPMAATNIEDGKNFVLNTSGFFGYLENNKNVPFNFDIVKPNGFYGATGLIARKTDEPITILKLEKSPENTNKRVDRYQVENYDRLIDSPLMYSKADTAVIQVANTEVLISAYSPNRKVSAKEIGAVLREILMAQKEYLGGELPVEKYAFIFYFTDKPISIYGALEHSYSSFYYMPEANIDAIRQGLRDMAAHEFFHIVTPLTIHSQEIHKFDFINPAMSKHLWLYEGVTEYFAGNMQVKYGIIAEQEYLNVMRQKMISSTNNYKDNVPFTDISKYTLDRYSDQYNNVYQKGALIGMCLDIKLRYLSAGKYGLQNLVADLGKKFGKNKAFNDEELFDEIVKLTYPEMGEFFKRYVSGGEPLPFLEVMKLVGVNYIPATVYFKSSCGFDVSAFGIEEIEGTKRLKLANLGGVNEQGNALGLKLGDILLKINGEELPAVGAGLFTGFLRKKESELKPSSTLTVTVLREDQSGVLKNLELTAPVIQVQFIESHQMSFDSNASHEQLTLRKTWLSAN